MTTANDIRAALATKYCPPEYCLFFEVSNSTGANIRRYADAVAMSIWPSRGFALHGFEIKVSRSDFIAEMRDPSKADAIGKYCDFWWLVTPPKLVDPAELPETWGLMALQKNGLRAVKQAPKTDAYDVTRGFMAALLRRHSDMEQAHIKAQIQKGENERLAAMECEVECRTKDIRQKLERQAEWAREFEAAFGQKPSTYKNAAGVAANIKTAEKLTGEWGGGALGSVKSQCERLARIIAEMQEGIPE